jgi:hypothetical protein
VLCYKLLLMKCWLLEQIMGKVFHNGMFVIYLISFSAFIIKIKKDII